MIRCTSWSTKLGEFFCSGFALTGSHLCDCANRWSSRLVYYYLVVIVLARSTTPRRRIGIIRFPFAAIMRTKTTIRRRRVPPLLQRNELGLCATSNASVKALLVIAARRLRTIFRFWTLSTGECSARPCFNQKTCASSRNRSTTTSFLKCLSRIYQCGYVAMVGNLNSFPYFPSDLMPRASPFTFFPGVCWGLFG